MRNPFEIRYYIMYKTKVSLFKNEKGYLIDFQEDKKKNKIDILGWQYFFLPKIFLYFDLEKAKYIQRRLYSLKNTNKTKFIIKRKIFWRGFQNET